MDIEKLIERLRNNNIENNCHDCALGYYAFEAATALSTLQAENEKLRAELEQVKRERDAAIEDVLDAAITPCSYCKCNPINGGSCDMDNETHEMYSCWKWSGPQKEG